MWAGRTICCKKMRAKRIFSSLFFNLKMRHGAKAAARRCFLSAKTCPLLRFAAAPKEKTSWRLFLYGIINAQLKRKGQSPSEAYAFIDGYRQRTTRAADMI